MTKTNHFKIAVTMLAALAVLATSLLGPAQPGYAQTSPQQTSNVVLVSPNSIKEGTPLDCVYEFVQQGMPIQEALAGCDFGDKATPEDPDDLSSALGFGGGSSAGTTVGSVSCSNGADPLVSAKPGWGLYENHLNSKPPPLSMPENGKETKDEMGNSTGYYEAAEYQKRKAEAQQKWEEYVDGLLKDNYAQKNGTPEEKEKSKQNLLQLEKDAKDALDKRNAWGPKIGEADPGTSDSDTSSETATTQTDPNADDACRQAAEFVAQCNANGWKSFECQQLLNQMKGCDATITDPMPGEEACAGESEPDPEEVERVAALVCGMRINPSDPDQDPCVPFEVDAQVLRSVVSLKDVCGSLIALTGEDQCVSTGTHPSVIYAKFRGKDIEEVMRMGQEKLGGPGWIIPMLGPGSPGLGTGPQPETGEIGPNPDLP